MDSAFPSFLAFGKIGLAFAVGTHTTAAFFETRRMSVRRGTQPVVREPRGNRGRLRHCNGSQTSHTSLEGRRPSEKAEARLESGVRIPHRLCSSVPRLRDNFSAQEKDEAGSLPLGSGGFAECLHSPSSGSEGFIVFGTDLIAPLLPTNRVGGGRV